MGRNYGTCKFCERFSDIKKYHRNLKYLSYLVQNWDQHNEPNSFRKITDSLLQISAKFRKISKAKRNKVVSKYLIYFVKHNYLVKIQSPSFSPIKREDVMEEFNRHLRLVSAIKIVY